MLIAPLRKALLGSGSRRRPQIVAMFDVLSSGNYTTGTGGLATIANQGPYPGISFAQSNTAIRPDLAATGINGGPAMQFTAANNESLVLLNARGAFGGTDGLWWFGVGEFASLPAVLNQFWTIFNSGGVGLVSFSLLASGKLRAIVRRVTGDTAKVVDSVSVLVPAGVPTAIGQSVDTRYGQVLCFSNQDHEYRATGTFTNGYGSLDGRIAASDPIFGRSGSATLDGFIGRIYAGTGVATPEFFEALRVQCLPIFNTPQRSLSFVATPLLRRNRIHQSIGGVADAPVSIMVTSGADADIYGRFLDITDRTPATGWETPQLLGTSSSLALEATPTVPDGSWYAEARKDGERDADAVVDTSNIIGVGSVTFFGGNSQSQKLATDVGGGPLYPQTTFPSAGDDLKDRRWSGTTGYYYLAQRIAVGEAPTGEPYIPQTLFDAGGNGTKIFGTLMRALDDGAPALVVPLGYGGTEILEHLDTGVARVNVLAALAPAEGPGYGFTRAMMSIGTVDINNGLAGATFYSRYEAYWQQVRALATAGDALYCYVHPVGWEEFGPTTTPNFRAIIGATWDLIADYDNDNTDGTGRIFLGCTDHDIPRADGVHLWPVDNHRLMRRLVQNIAYREKGATHGARGPKLTTVTAASGGSTIVGTFVHDGPGGTILKGRVYDAGDPYTLAPTFATTGLTGTRVEINGSEVTPSSIDITDTDKVTWTVSHTFAPGDTFTIALYDVHNFDQSVMLMDDTNPRGDVVGVPAQPTLGVSGVVA